MQDTMAKSPTMTFFCRIEIALQGVQDVGPTASGTRRVSLIQGGSIGGTVTGTILEGGSDWQLIRSDGVVEIGARYVARLATGELVGIHCDGLRHGPADVMSALGRGEAQPAESYYFSCTLRLEGKQALLAGGDRSVIVANGVRDGGRVILDAFLVGR